MRFRRRIRINSRPDFFQIFDLIKKSRILDCKAIGTQPTVSLLGVFSNQYKMKTVIITGASRGIGLATAKKFLAEGWRVIGAYLNTPISLQDNNLIAIQYDQLKNLIDI